MTIDIARLRNFHDDFIRDLRREVEAEAKRTGDLIKLSTAQAPEFKHATGALAAATEVTTRSERRGTILRLLNRKKYALAQERGSGTHAGRGPYEIRAKRAKALRFMGSGGLVFRRKVMHPGVPATHWLLNAIRRSEPNTNHGLELRLSQLARKFSRQRV